MHQAYCPDCKGKGRVTNKAASSLPLILLFWPAFEVLKDNCQRCGGSGVIIQNDVRGYVGSDSLPRRVDLRV